MKSKISLMVFIYNNAASAGAMISITCESIYMRPGANIGAVTGVIQTGDLVPEKQYQYYLPFYTFHLYT